MNKAREFVFYQISVFTSNLKYFEKNKPQPQKQALAI